MKKILLLSASLSLLLLSSCSKYQMGMISSVNAAKDDKTGNFNIENDTVKIIYSFAGKNAPMTISVFNKLDEPLYIDWERSAFIVDNKAISYVNKDLTINGNTNSQSYSINHISASNGTFDGTVKLPDNLSFIPPHTQVSKNPLMVTSTFFDGIPEESFKKTPLYNAVTEGNSNVRVAEFTQDNSPLTFKSYLTLYTKSKANFPIVFQQAFFVSKVINSNNNPTSFDYFLNSRGDYFYTSQVTGYGKTMTAVAVAAALGTVAATDASLKKPNSSR